jgi:glycosyltransferase A (GT-A) superfamily protein (DUF2064 family)/SAM-dependent methyltransferase
MRPSRTLLVLAKEPRPGLVKTRLQSQFSPLQAARLAAASLADTLAAVRSAEVDRRVLALDGTAGDWLPDGVEVVDQGGGGLDLRLESAFGRVFETAGPSPRPQEVLLVGMDTPQLTTELLTRDWDGADAALGLSADGGFWAVGLRRPCPGVFTGVPMSTDRTGAVQLARLRARGLRVHLLPVLRDVDTPDDAAAVAALAPGTRFARLHRRLLTTEHPLELYAAALNGRRIRVESADGQDLALDVGRWTGAPDGIDRMMLNRCEAPVLDVGCGPGRLVGALAEAGTPALGVDVSSRAVQLTADRGACVLRRPIEGPLPGEGRWGTVLLADGNVGIGGDPEALLRRCRELLHPAGLLLVEVDPDDGLADVGPITLVDPSGRRAHPLPWARVGSAVLVRMAPRTGFLVVEEWRVLDRVFLALRATSRPGAPGPDAPGPGVRAGRLAVG